MTVHLVMGGTPVLLMVAQLWIVIVLYMVVPYMSVLQVVVVSVVGLAVVHEL